MAEKLADALVYLGTEASGLKKGFDDAKTQTQSWASNLGGIAKTALTGVVLGAATAAVGAVVAIGAGATSVAMQTRQAAADMAASLGIPKEEAEKFAEVAKAVYGDGLGDSVGDAAVAVSEITKQMRLAADDPALKQMTKNAIMLRDVFEADVKDSVSTAQSMIEEFGISGQEAFDLMAWGYQNNMDVSGDMLDTLREYGPVMAANGFSAQQMFSLMQSGAAAGVLGTDKIIDAFKEFGIILNEGTDSAKAALASMGMDYDAMAATVRDGTADWADYSQQIIDGINAIEDPIARSQAQVALFGTMAEDMGSDFTLGLSTSAVAMEQMAGATDSLGAKYETLGKVGEAIWRRLIVSVSPLADKLLDMVNSVMPTVLGAFDQFDAAIGPIMENASGLIDRTVQAIKGFFAQFRVAVDGDATGPLAYWKQWADENLPRLQQIFQFVLEAIQGFWTSHGETVMTVVNNTFTVVFSVIDTTLRTVGDLVTAFLQLLTGDFEGMGQTLIGIVGRIWETVLLVFQTQLDSIFTLFGLKDWASAGAAIVEGIQNGIAGAWNNLTDWFSSRLQGLRNLLPFSEPKDPTSPLRNLSKSGAAMVEMFGDGMTSELDRLRGSLSGGLASLVGAPSTAGAAVAGGDTYHIAVSLDSGGYEAGVAAGNGIVDALRRRGRG